MHTYLDCVACFVRQTIDVVSMVTPDPALREQAVREVLRASAELDFAHVTPAAMGQRIHRLIRELTENPDPYREIKRRSNAAAMGLLPQVRSWLSDAADPFETAVRLALAGNVIDFGVNHATDISDDGVGRMVAEAMEAPLSTAGVDRLRVRAQDARSILYLCDNAGEIVFDALLIEQLGPSKVRAAVRGGPIINDATLEDARAVGLDRLVTVLDSGCDAPGTILEQCTPEFREAFDEADLIIAKGQGNFETLSGVEAPLFFLLKAKCPVIARHIGCAEGRYLVLWHDDVKGRQEPEAAGKEIFDA